MTALKTNLIVLVLAFASICTAGGGSGGGVASVKYITVEVCGGGESGDQCRLVTYKVRPPNPVTPEMCMFGEAGEEKPCSQIKTTTPSWLKNLSTSTIESTDAASNPNNNDDSGGN